MMDELAQGKQIHAAAIHRYGELTVENLSLNRVRYKGGFVQ
jgi:hypothetical protein